MRNVSKSIIVYIITLSALLLGVMKLDVYAIPNEDLIEAIENGNLQAVKNALRNGADINMRERIGPYRTILMIVAGQGKWDLAKVLVESGANVNATDVHGDTALMEACREGHLNIVELLIEHGANLNAAVNVGVGQGYTPLIYAAESGHVNVVKCLLKHDANINAKKDGDTALIIAEKNGHMDVARILREAGAR